MQTSGRGRLTLALREEVLGSKDVFTGNILKLRVDDIEAADGHRATREVIETAGAVAVVCVDDGEIVLVRQYRHPIGKVLLEIPAGKIDPGESPEACAARELVEECGLRPASLEKWVTYHAAPGFTNHELTIYFTDDVTPEPGSTEAGEVIEVERRRLDELETLIASPECQDSKTLIGLLLLAQRR